MKADKVYINGDFHTLVTEDSTVEAVAVYDSRIVFAGTTEEALKIPAEEVVDMGGKTIIPAFQDTHCHLTNTMERTKQVNLINAESIDEIIEMLKEKETSLSEGEWLLGYCIHLEKLKEGRFPDKNDLDRISLDRPVYVISYCGHASMANSKALELAGIKKGFVPPPESFVDVDADGNPTGILREHITAYMMQFAGAVFATEESAEDYLAEVCRQFAAYGVTTIHSNETAKPEGNLTVKQLLKMKEEKKLPIRVYIDYSKAAPNSLGILTGFGDDMLKVGSEKFFIDGSMNSHTAAMCEPYSCDPKHKGQLIYEKDEDFMEAVKKSYDYGYSIAVHTIGDYAMDLMIRTIKYCCQSGIKHRFRIIHAMLVKKEHLEELKKLPVILDTQPNFLLNWVNSCIKNIGEERAKLFLPYRTYLDTGLLVTGGSDAPVETFNPLIGIQCAVTRQDLKHNPPEVFEPQERISVYEAVCLYTKNAAFSSMEEADKGTIEVGKLADFAVLNENIFTISPEMIASAHVTETILGGKTVYSA